MKSKDPQHISNGSSSDLFPFCANLRFADKTQSRTATSGTRGSRNPWLFTFFVIVLLFGGNILLAHAAGPSVPYWGPLISCTGGNPFTTASGQQIPSCTNFCDVLSTGQNILYFAITVALLIITPIFVLWAGFLMLTAGGNETKVGEGKKMLTGIAIGVGIILASFLLVKTFIVLLALAPAEGGHSYIKGFSLTDPLECSVPAYVAPNLNSGSSGGTGGTKSCSSYTAQGITACNNAPENCIWDYNTTPASCVPVAQ